MKADLVLALARAHYERNESFFRILLKQAASQVRAEGVKAALLRLSEQNVIQLSPDVAKYVSLMAPQAIDELVLAPGVLAHLETIVEEIRCRGELLARRILPRSRLLFHGPPGNGKSATAAALGSMLGCSAYAVSLNELVSSYLGATGGNIGKVFEALSAGALVVLDEIDAIGTARSNAEGSGAARELNSTVNVMLTLLDRVRDGVLIGLTNRREMLDKALLRRFDQEIVFDPPDDVLAERLVGKLCERYALSRDQIALVDWANFDDIAKAVQAVARRVAMAEIRQERKVKDADAATNLARPEGGTEETETAALEGAAG